MGEGGEGVVGVRTGSVAAPFHLLTFLSYFHFIYIYVLFMYIFMCPIFCVRLSNKVLP